jgi:Fur family transcriptional regulator, stress-responsive regulator
MQQDLPRDTLRSAGLRVTPQRVALLAALRSVYGHATAETLQTAAREAGIEVPLPTVYAVLSDLVRAGLVRQVHGEGGATQFDANVARHHHLACVRCGALHDVPCTDVNDTDPCIVLEDPRGWQVRSAEVTFRGLCPRCQLNPAKE